ncbi:hypothetical protein RN001_011540 [Aquatica leii]|uniref:Uncharacterized protein n=1 Tax=Aquatica leii TaxID=1421715 RepID=A0AAN7QDX6_9COLE|nr:hypothetical protein RN001_011540 [Aquatica leii]
MLFFANLLRTRHGGVEFRAATISPADAVFHLDVCIYTCCASVRTEYRNGLFNIVLKRLLLQLPTLRRRGPYPHKRALLKLYLP